MSASSEAVEPRGFVAVPRALLQSQLLAVDVAVWVLLAGYIREGRPVAWPSRDTLMMQLGRPGRRGDAVTRATARLARRGWLKVRRRHWAGRTRNVYQVRTDQGDPYAHLSRAVVADLAEGRLDPEELVAYARWLDVCGEQGWTRDTLTKHAKRYQVSVHTAKHVRARLVALGLLEVRSSPGWLCQPDLAPG